MDERRTLPPCSPCTAISLVLPLSLALVVVVLDQLTKYMVCQGLNTWTSRIDILPGLFSIVHVRNTGAAWGILRDQTMLLAILSVGVGVGIVLRFRQLVEGHRERVWALGLVLGGIAGNLIDRVLWGSVIDFLSFYYRSFEWPAFNVADSAISCGVGLFVLSSLMRKQEDAEPDARPLG